MWEEGQSHSEVRLAMCALMLSGRAFPLLVLERVSRGVSRRVSSGVS